MNHYHLLQTCNSLKTLKSIHAHLIISNSILFSNFILNKIIRLYSRFGDTCHARKVFDKIPQPNSFLWTSMIHGYVKNKNYRESFYLFTRMRSEGIEVLNFTFCSVIKGLAKEKRLGKDGNEVYGFLLKYGYGDDILVQNAVLDSYMRGGEVDFARRVFDNMVEKDVVSWNSMISGYVSNGRVKDGRELFDEMPERNAISFTSLVFGYVKVGDMVEAQALFDAMPVKDSASWNVMISGYIENGDLDAARFAFESSKTRDVGTWNLMASGFAKAGKFQSAQEYFSRMPSKNAASWAILINRYVKSGDVDKAREIFDQLPDKNLVTWSTMIAGYAKNGQPRRALDLFEIFKKQGIKPDETFILGIISACSQLGILGAVESIMKDYVGPSLLSNVRVVTSLIDMYAKCGSIKKAYQVFESSKSKDLLTYSTMISAFANHGQWGDSIYLFNEMVKKNVRPDSVAFLSVILACNHGGLVDEGKEYFKQMITEFGLKPSEKHYACMVGLFGRAGCLEEAHDIIKNMHLKATSVIWGALLSGCAIHSDIEFAEIAAAELFNIEPENSGNYMLLSGIYAAKGRWNDVARVKAMVRERRVRKNKGSSWIELGSVVHEFVMTDVLHSQSDSIFRILDLLQEHMKLSRFGIESEINTIDGLRSEIYNPICIG